MLDSRIVWQIGKTNGPARVAKAETKAAVNVISKIVRADREAPAEVRVEWVVGKAAPEAVRAARKVPIKVVRAVRGQAKVAVKEAEVVRSLGRVARARAKVAPVVLVPATNPTQARARSGGVTVIPEGIGRKHDCADIPLRSGALWVPLFSFMITSLDEASQTAASELANPSHCRYAT